MRFDSFLNGRIPTALLMTLVISSFLVPSEVSAEVVKLEITSREVVSDLPELIGIGAYEVIKGIIHLEVDPDNPANRQIADLKLAPRNERGYVEFSTEFELHKPVDADRGNHRLIYFVNNRGNKMALGHFNRGAEKNWLYSKGWSYIWCGWNCDVPESESRLNISVPVATDNGKSITGKIYAEMISYANGISYSQPIVWGGSIAYPAASEDDSQASLTMRRYRRDDPVEVPRDHWSFGLYREGEVIPDSNSIYIKEGFKPGWLYDLVYVGKDPKVTGLGLAAIRDVVSFFKYEEADKAGFGNPLAGVVEYAHAWGHSQSARLLYHFVYQDFNGDEKQRKVFDGVMANCPGAGKGLFNSRFAQPTRHGSHHEDNFYPIDFFPFATVEQVDPITGERGDALAAAREHGFLPKMFFINSSTDYWTRAASLLHTDVEGKEDAAIDPNVRIYLAASKAHTDDRIGFIGRALLTALDLWVSQGAEPPASQIPKISDGTLVDLEGWLKAFPDIPGVQKPPSFYHPYRLDMGPRWQTEGIADHVPPKAGARYVCLVPLVDEDGNEIAGIRLPEIAAPLATSNGWSMRNPLFSQTLRRNAGRILPLSRTAEERLQKEDPRRSILERYPSKADYLAEVTKCLLKLKSERLLLDEDVSRLLMEAARLTYWPTEEGAPRVSIKEVSAQPTEVEAGDSVMLTVVFEGSDKDVMTVQANFREANNLYYVLNNDGDNGDETAGDNVWSVKGRIPSDLRSDEFHIDFRALDKDLNAIYLTGTVKEGFGEQGSLVFTVK